MVAQHHVVQQYAVPGSRRRRLRDPSRACRLGRNGYARRLGSVQSPMRLLFAAAMAALVSTVPARAEKVSPRRQEVAREQVRLQIVDLTPQFLTFYAAAEGADHDSRFKLWQEHYGFAAVPPGPEGDKIARRMLDAAWPRYADAMGTIRAGADGLGGEPLEIADRVYDLLGVSEPLTIRLTTYVGAFDDNAFTSRTSAGVPNVYFATDTTPARGRVILPHEMTHAVHLHLAGISGGWERTIGATIVMEGLAVHATREIAPGLSEAEYIEYTPGWWRKAQAQKTEILAGILPAVGESKPETVFKYTMGAGSVGLEREAYAAGYWVVEQLRREGMTLSQIARVPEAEMPALSQGAIERLLKARPGDGEGTSKAPRG